MKTYLQLNAQKDSLSGPLAFRMVVIRFFVFFFVVVLLYFILLQSFKGYTPIVTYIHLYPYVQSYQIHFDILS